MKVKRLISCLLSVMLIISAAAPPLTSSAFEVGSSYDEKASLNIAPSGESDNVTSYYLGNNFNKQNYSYNWASPITSYLYNCNDGNIVRFQYYSKYNGYLVEYYSSDYRKLGRKIIPYELDLFGGYFCDGENNFIVTGQNNPEESSSQEVYRVTKYDKNWNRISSSSLYGSNTTSPFNAGSLRMASCGRYLLIRTCHQMYTSSDGKKHQANYNIEYDMVEGKITDSFNNTDGGAGYVSHSFNQFIRIENNKIVSVDHGDAYPRSIVIHKYKTDVTTGKFIQ